MPCPTCSTLNSKLPTTLSIPWALVLLRKPLLSSTWATDVMLTMRRLTNGVSVFPKMLVKLASIKSIISTVNNIVQRGGVVVPESPSKASGSA